MFVDPIRNITLVTLSVTAKSDVKAAAAKAAPNVNIELFKKK